MTTVALDAFFAQYDNSGNPLSGGKLFTYAAGTLAPLATYTDRGGLTPNANPVILNSAGRADVWLSTNVAYQLILQDSAGNVIDSVDQFYAGADPAQLTAAGIVPSTGGTYTGLVSFTGGATFDGTPTQDLATLDSLGIAGTQVVNLFANNDLSSFPGGAGTYADGAISFAKVSVLCDTGSVGVTQIAQPANGIPFAMRITQPDAAPKRIGFVQQVTAANCVFYRGKQLILVPQIRCSVATTIRVALVAFTGTADAAPADVVNNWASTNYTAGNFFIANTSTIAVTGTAASAATWVDCPASSASGGGVVAPSNMNNLYMVVWTDLAVAQNVTLDAATVRCSPGVSTPLYYSPNPSIYGRLLNVQTFTANGTYTPTPGTTSVVVEVIGGGGGGGGGSAGAANFGGGGGGGGGGYAMGLLTSGFSGAAVVVGSAGTGVAGVAGNGGGPSSFAGAVLGATGGGGGAGAGFNAANLGAGGLPGVGSGTGANLAVAQGGPGATGIALAAGTVVSGAGGSSFLGGGPLGLVSGSVAGTSATTRGAGGSGATTATGNVTNITGGSGQAGYVRVWEYA